MSIRGGAEAEALETVGKGPCGSDLASPAPTHLTAVTERHSEPTPAPQMRGNIIIKFPSLTR
jgi:hypothetical protein